MLYYKHRNAEQSLSAQYSSIEQGRIWDDTKNREKEVNKLLGSSADKGIPT